MLCSGRNIFWGFLSEWTIEKRGLIKEKYLYWQLPEKILYFLSKKLWRWILISKLGRCWKKLVCLQSHQCEDQIGWLMHHTVRVVLLSSPFLIERYTFLSFITQQNRMFFIFLRLNLSVKFVWLIIYGGRKSFVTSIFRALVANFH